MTHLSPPLRGVGNYSEIDNSKSTGIMKAVYFFCVLYMSGTVFSESKNMTQTQADEHLGDLRKSENVKRAYCARLEGAVL